MDASRLRIVILGYIIRGPFGGMTWHHLQYVKGFESLGHDVYFLEDSDEYPSCYNPETYEMSTDCAYGINYARLCFDRVGLSNRWAYYDAHTQTWFGPAADNVLAICASADVLINVSGINPMRDWLEQIPLRVLIDTDPVFLQVRHLRNEQAKQLAARHTAFLSFGENIGGIASIPDDGFPWVPTRQPVVLDCWPVTDGPKDGCLTTVMQWDSYPPAQYQGRFFGMKSMSFNPYKELPKRTAEHFELAIGNPPIDLAGYGWDICNPLEVTKDPWTYQSFIMRSKAEFSVAKHGYVVSRSGWFSERSACYLASGRPVVVQDTGFPEWLPNGRGVIAFKNPDEALRGIEEIDAHYALHCKCARDIAEAYFDSRIVLPRLLSVIERTPSESN